MGDGIDMLLPASLGLSSGWRARFEEELVRLRPLPGEWQDPLGYSALRSEALRALLSQGEFVGGGDGI